VTVGHNPLVHANVAAFGSQDLGFRTSINGHWVSLSGPRVSGPRKLSILRSSYLFPVTFLCIHCHFSPASSFPVTFFCVHRHFSLRACVRASIRAGSAIKNASRWSVIGRAGSAVENASRTPSHPTAHGLSEFIYKICCELCRGF
jgi:hypothetical protein